jgi:hypothetical protein
MDAHFSLSSCTCLRLIASAVESLDAARRHAMIQHISVPLGWVFWHLSAAELCSSIGWLKPAAEGSFVFPQLVQGGFVASIAVKGDSTIQCLLRKILSQFQA